jgi:hypothetical protein
MKKNILIPEEDFMNALFLAIYVQGNYEEEKIQELADKVSASHLEKLDAIIKRGFYIKYKTAPTGEEKEKARIEYLAHTDLILDKTTYEKILKYRKDKK